MQPKPIPKLPAPEALSHVLYEIGMMADCIARMGKPYALDGFQKNLHLEGFVYHARTLDAFFQTTPNANVRDDDIVPEYFGYSSAKSLYTQRFTFERAHKEMAHLSHARKSNVADKLWHPHVELAKIAPVCIDFLKFVMKDTKLMAFDKNLPAAKRSLLQLQTLVARGQKTMMATGTSASDTVIVSRK